MRPHFEALVGYEMFIVVSKNTVVIIMGKKSAPAGGDDRNRPYRALQGRGFVNWF